MKRDPQKGDQYRHVRTGNIYRVICTANLESQWPAMVVYESVVGFIYARPLDEFESKFVIC